MARNCIVKPSRTVRKSNHDRLEQALDHRLAVDILRSMKKLLSVLSVGLLLAGCGGEAEQAVQTPDWDDPKVLEEIQSQAIDNEELKVRGKKGEELAYAPDSQTPYTGWLQETDGKGKRRRLGYFKEGRLDGPFAAWYPNGVKTMEGSFVEGRMHSASGWKPDGEKCSVTKVENGNGVWLRYDVTAYDKQKWRPVQLVKFHEDGETVMEIIKALPGRNRRPR